ncbi:cation:proton antiporter [Pleurocapsales cyanobacterium LEGE 06147]|nr:cation:proton antiporter [Pleurocapsales cyanobacterium LEGE 06147]
MTNITIAWMALPFFVGFVIYLLPKLGRFLALAMALVSASYALQIFLEQSPLDIQLLDNFGVTLAIDELSGFFILTNALVSASVILYCWGSDKTAFFYMQTIILHGSVNATFICADFISLYVALEVISIAAFLLIAYPRSDRSIWIGLRYLFVSNTAMLFYLVGAVLVYQAHHSFHFAGLRGAPLEAIALILLGLLVKGGVFISGLWLPLTHSESETPVSAMLSGVVIKAGVFPLVRCALMLEEIDPIVRFFGVSTALLGVGYAVLEKDTKRMLAFSTISQLGFVLAAPVVGGFYALTHGLVKSALFLIAGVLPSRNFEKLQYKPIDTRIWIALVIASFSISGFPLLSGFGAKVLTNNNLLPWQIIAMNIAALGTAIAFAKFIFLPHKQLALHHDEMVKVDEKTGREGDTGKKIQPGFWWAMTILLGGLIAANGVYYEAYTVNNIVKPLVIIAIAWLAYFLIFKKSTIKLSRAIEKFDHLIGVMAVMLILLFWIVWTRSPISI